MRENRSACTDSIVSEVRVCKVAVVSSSCMSFGFVLLFHWHFAGTRMKETACSGVSESESVIVNDDEHAML